MRFDVALASVRHAAADHPVVTITISSDGGLPIEAVILGYDSHPNLAYY